MIDLIDKVQHGMLYPPTDAESGTFNPVYIDNAIDALIIMGTHQAALAEAFNIVDGTPMLFSEYIRRLARMATVIGTAIAIAVVMRYASRVLRNPRLSPTYEEDLERRQSLSLDVPATEAVRLNAAALIVAHNHPSGDPTPSRKAWTRAMEPAPPASPFPPASPSRRRVQSFTPRRRS